MRHSVPPHWVAMATFGTLVVATQYYRICRWLELEELHSENIFLCERIHDRIADELCRMSNETYTSTIHLLWMNFTATTAKKVHNVLPTFETQSGVPTFVFLAAVMLYFWRIACWLQCEMERYGKLSNQSDVERYNLVNFFFYRADYWLSYHRYAKAIGLTTVVVVIIVIGGLLRGLLSSTPLGEAIWQSWTFIMDTSAHADEVDILMRISALLLTMGGMFVFAMVVSFVAEALDEYFNYLHSGAAPVLESDHIVILGWSDKVLMIIKELALANMSCKGCVIAILSDVKKVEMEEMLAEAHLDLHGCTIVCRRGNPTVEQDLDHVFVRNARAIVIVSPPFDHDTDEADGFVMRSLLCLVGMNLRCHIVVELQDVRNQELVHIIGGFHVETVVANDFVGRLIVQSKRQRGLTKVMEHLVGFEGNEFYFRAWSELLGKEFGNIVFQFPAAVPVGVLRADGTSVLNPPDGFIIKKGDQLIVVAEDDDTYAPALSPLRTIQDVEDCPYEADEESFVGNEHIKEADIVLVLGWRRDLGNILAELNDNVGEGSVVTVMSEYPDVDGSRNRELASDGSCDPSTFENLAVDHVVGSPVCRKDLAQLPLYTYKTVFILHEDHQGGKQVDCRAITSLFLVRDVHEHQMQEQGLKYRPLMIITEVLDMKTRHLLNLAGIHDFVMSNQVVSSALAMVVECRAVNNVLKELLAVEGCELYIHYVSQYCPVGLILNFWDLQVIVRHAGHLLLGYLLDGSSTPDINPVDKETKRRWTEHDRLVILCDL